MTAFELAGKLNLDSSEFTSSLKKQESAFSKFGNKIKNTANFISKVAKASAVAGTVMFTKSSIQEGLNFDAAMSQVAATLGKTTDEVQELAMFARKMGSETAFSATEAAEALNYMALAGYDSEKSMRMLPTVLNLAAAGNMDLATASDMVTDAQSALGLSIEETETMVNQMAKTSSRTNTSVEQLGSAILTVGGTAKNLKGGTTELNALLGVLADNGIKGAEGGTALRNVLLSLTAPTNQAAEALESLGVKVFDEAGNMKEFPEVLQDIKEATKGMTQAQRTNFLSTVFNKRDLKAIEALLGTTQDRWSELYEEIGNASGSAGQMAGTQLDNLAGDLKIFQSAVSEAKLSISDKLTPALRSFVQKGTVWVQRLTNAFNKNGFSGALNELGTLVKETITEYLDIGSDSSWLDIGKAIVNRIKDGFRKSVGGTKVKIANLLGMTDGNGNVIDDPSDVSWLNIAKSAVENLRNKVINIAGTAKVKIANLLGMTDESGNVVDDPDDVSWKEVARNVIEKVKTGFKDFTSKTKVRLANWLGLTDESGNAVDDPSDTSWSSIAESIKTKLKGGFEKLKVNLADLLGITPENAGGDVSWEDIGREIIGKLTSYFSHKGDFLKKLILGDEFTDQSTWKDVGSKISGWMSEAFKEGGLIDAILGNTAEKAEAIASFAGELMAGIAKWVGENSGAIVNIVTSIIDAATKALPHVVRALTAILRDPQIWTAVGDMLKALWKAIFGTPEENLNNNLFSGFTGQDFAALQEYISAYNDLQDKVERLLDMDATGQTDTEEYTKLQEEATAASEAVEQLGAKLAEITSDDGKSLFASYMTWFHEHGGSNGKLLEIPTELIPDGTKVLEETNAGYDATVRLHPDDSEIGFGTGIYAHPHIIPKHAKGLQTVPYDDYVASLHRGEAVLTASQARRYRDGVDSTFDVAGLERRIEAAIRRGMEGVEVRSFIDGDEVTDRVNRRNMQAVKGRRFAT